MQALVGLHAHTLTAIAAIIDDEPEAVVELQLPRNVLRRVPAVAASTRVPCTLLVALQSLMTYARVCPHRCMGTYVGMRARSYVHTQTRRLSDYSAGMRV